MTIQRKPLTKEQQATVVKWRPLAVRYAGRMLHGLGLHEFKNEVPSIAADALMEAVRVWRPEDANFPACLRWWVRRVLQDFRSHDARTVHQAVDSRHFAKTLSLNKTTNRDDPDAETTWQDLLVDESVRDAGDVVDSRRLLRKARGQLVHMVAGRNPTPLGLRKARESVRLWGERVLGGCATLDELGEPLGLTREAVRRRVLLVDAEFAKWAAELREEAA